MKDRYTRIVQKFGMLGLDIKDKELAAVAGTLCVNDNALELFDRVLDIAMANKMEKTVATLRKFSKFPVHKTLESFDFGFQPSLDKEKIDSFATLGFVHSANNIIFMGPTGTGKSHLAVSLGEKCLEQGLRTYYITLADLGTKLKDAEENKKKDKVMASLCRPSCLIIDEVGYEKLDLRASELVFQLVSKYYEKKSIIITTNYPISRWGEIFHDETLAQVIADKLVHHAEIIKITGNSYRLKGKINQ